MHCFLYIRSGLLALLLAVSFLSQTLIGDNIRALRETKINAVLVQLKTAPAPERLRLLRWLKVQPLGESSELVATTLATQLKREVGDLLTETASVLSQMGINAIEISNEIAKTNEPEIEIRTNPHRILVLVLPALIEGARWDRPVRSEAQRVVAHLAPEAASDELTHLILNYLNSPSVTERSLAARAIGCIWEKVPQALAPLSKMLEQGPELLDQATAAEAFYRLPLTMGTFEERRKVGLGLVELVDGVLEEDIRLIAIRALGNFSEAYPEAVAVLKKAAENKALKRTALRSLGGVAPDDLEVAKFLGEIATKDAHVGYRVAAIHGMTRPSNLKNTPSNEFKLRLLIQSVTDREPEVRLEATRALKNWSAFEEAQNTLLTALASEDVPVRNTAFVILIEMANAPWQRITSTLSSYLTKDPTIPPVPAIGDWVDQVLRRAPHSALADWFSRAADGELSLEMLAHLEGKALPFDGGRFFTLDFPFPNAFDAIEMAGPKVGKAYLHSMRGTIWEEKHPDVRRAYFNLIGRWGRRAVPLVPDLLALLRENRGFWVFDNITENIQKMGEEAIPKLEELLAQPEIAPEALKVLRSVTSKPASFYFAYFNHPEPRVRQAAISALRGTKDDVPIDDIRRSLRILTADPDEHVREKALFALVDGGDRSPETAKILHDRLTHDSSKLVRNVAISWISQLREHVPNALSLIVRHGLRSSDDDLKERSLAALAFFTPDELTPYVPEFVRLLEPGNYHCHLPALMALNASKTQNQAVVDAILRTILDLAEPDPENNLIYLREIGCQTCVQNRLVGDTDKNDLSVPAAAAFVFLNELNQWNVDPATLKSAQNKLFKAISGKQENEKLVGFFGLTRTSNENIKKDACERFFKLFQNRVELSPQGREWLERMHIKDSCAGMGRLLLPN